MEDYIKKSCRNSLLISILLIILSIVIIAKPEISLTIIMIIIGILLILSGGLNIFAYFKSPKEIQTFNIKLILGILSVILGFIVIFNTSIINTVILYIIGSWIIIESIVKLQIAFNLKNLNSGNWVIMLVLSIITLILGIIILFNPFATLITVTVLSAVMLLITELINLFEAIYVLLKV